MLTTEVFTIPLAEGYLIYAPLRRIALLGNPQLVNLLARLRGGGIEDLNPAESRLVRFLEEIRLLGLEGDSPIATYGSPSFEPTQVTLFLTSRCNLRCTYCYAETGSKPPVDIEPRAAERAIDFACSNALEGGSRGITVGFHGGGEPTMNWRALVAMVAYARQRGEAEGLDVRTTMATNGVLSASKRRWILNNIDSLSLSWDGVPAVQDAQRPLASGNPSAKIVLRTIVALTEARIPFGVRMTVTAGSAGRLAESVKYLLDHARPARIQVEPVYDLGRGRDGALHVNPDRFVSAFWEARAVAQSAEVELFFSAAQIDRLTSRFCLSCGEGFSITPGGRVSACFEVCDLEAALSDKFLFGAYDERRDRFWIDMGKLAELRRRTVETIPWCQGCYCRWHCAGDCPHKALQASAGGTFEGHARCEITRRLVLTQLLEKIERSGGVLWIGGRKDTRIPDDLIGVGFQLDQDRACAGVVGTRPRDES